MTGFSTRSTTYFERNDGGSGTRSSAPLTGFEDVLATHVGLKYSRNGDAPVFELILFHDGNQRTRGGDGGRIQRVNDGLVGVARLTVADAESVGLIVGAV